MYSNYKLGKRSPRHDARTLRLAKYAAALDTPPAAIDYGKTLTSLGDMQNDEIGDCTCAGAGHLIQTWTAANGNQVILADDEIVDLYSAVTGYKRGDESTDNGAVLLDVLRYWKANPLKPGHVLTAYAQVNQKNQTEVKQGIWMFGGLYCGVMLPLSAQMQGVWDVPEEGTAGAGTIGSWGGHCVPIVAYDDQHLTCISWGQLIKMTWRFFDTYFDEAWALLSGDWANTAGSPQGLDIRKLLADIAQL